MTTLIRLSKAGKIVQSSPLGIISDRIATLAIESSELTVEDLRMGERCVAHEKAQALRVKLSVTFRGQFHDLLHVAAIYDTCSGIDVGRRDAVAQFECEGDHWIKPLHVRLLIDSEPDMSLLDKVKRFRRQIEACRPIAFICELRFDRPSGCFRIGLA